MQLWSIAFDGIVTRISFVPLLEFLSSNHLLDFDSDPTLISLPLSTDFAFISIDSPEYSNSSASIKTHSATVWTSRYSCIESISLVAESVEFLRVSSEVLIPSSSSKGFFALSFVKLLPKSFVLFLLSDNLWISLWTSAVV